MRYSVRQITGVDGHTLLGLAEAALVDLGYQIDRRDGVAGILIAHPIALSEQRSPGLPVRRTRTDRAARLSSAGETRRMAELRVEQAGEAATLSCRVVVQEQTTQAHRLFARDQLGEDAPTYTPIELEAATTKRQNTIWRTVRRDRQAERLILAAITDRTQNTGVHGADRK